MNKRIFKDDDENVHFGVNPPSDGFAPADKSDVESILANLGDKRMWRCTVCNDLHIGAEPPKECPTCNAIDAYVEIDENEFRAAVGL